MAYDQVNQAIKNSPNFQDSHNSFQHRPRMLKDFLKDDCFSSCPSSSSSSSSNGLKIYPQKNTSNKSNVQFPNSKSMVLLRSQSKKAAATTLSALHRVISIVKFLPFTYTNSKVKKEISPNVKVIVKDILRWRSFRDLGVDQVERCTTPLSTLGYKMCALGKDAAFMNISKEGWSFEESEQQSPVSVLESNEKCISPFHQSLRNNENTTLQEKEEEKTLLLLNYIKETCLVDGKSESHLNDLILENFMKEISTNNSKCDSELLRNVNSWMSGKECNESYEWELQEKREAYVKDMEKEFVWNKFDHEQDNISKELERVMLNELLDEVMDEFIDC